VSIDISAEQVQCNYDTETMSDIRTGHWRDGKLHASASCKNEQKRTSTGRPRFISNVEEKDRAVTNNG
jgi:hypothetical protein